MSRLKVVRMLFVSAVLGACTIRIGPLDDSVAPTGMPGLPVDEGSANDPPLDTAQQARQEEVDR